MIYTITSWKGVEEVIKFHLLPNQGQPYFFMDILCLNLHTDISLKVQNQENALALDRQLHPEGIRALVL